MSSALASPPGRTAERDAASSRAIESPTTSSLRRPYSLAMAAADAASFGCTALCSIPVRLNGAVSRCRRANRARLPERTPLRQPLTLACWRATAQASSMESIDDGCGSSPGVHARILLGAHV
eukprot:3481209-Prymnesium_polylepis.1